MVLGRIDIKEARRRWPDGLGKCVKGQLCMDPHIATVIHLNITAGIVKSQRKIGKWEKQQVEAQEKSDDTQNEKLAAVIAREYSYIGEMGYISKMVEAAAACKEAQKEEAKAPATKPKKK